MKIIALRPSCDQEKRAPLTPDHVPLLTQKGFSVWVDAQGIGPFSGSSYADKGAILATSSALYDQASIALCIDPPTPDTLQALPSEITFIGLLEGREKAALQRYQDSKATVFSLDLMPRTSRAQFMDVLSSQSSLLGYRAVIHAAQKMPRIIPGLTTAAGSLSAARFLILGAGVAGLQAIGTAKRLGARVSACDIRPAAQEEVESLGAQFMPLPRIQGDGKGGYARALNLEEQQMQHAFLKDLLPSYDVVICTALIPGREPPLLITSAMTHSLKPGSVLIDLATEGRQDHERGNCEVSRPGQEVWVNGSCILGTSYELSTVPVSASLFYSRNLISFLDILWDTENHTWHNTDEDDILKATCVVNQGRIVEDPQQ